MSCPDSACEVLEKNIIFKQELALLGMLYGLFQKFIRFDEVFRDTLWADVDLESSHREVLQNFFLL